jgi:hypothetical protein
MQIDVVDGHTVMTFAVKSLITDELPAHLPGSCIPDGQQGLMGSAISVRIDQQVSVRSRPEVRTPVVAVGQLRALYQQRVHSIPRECVKELAQRDFSSEVSGGVSARRLEQLVGDRTTKIGPRQPSIRDERQNAVELRKLHNLVSVRSGERRCGSSIAGHHRTEKVDQGFKVRQVHRVHRVPYPTVAPSRHDLKTILRNEGCARSAMAALRCQLNDAFC